MIEQKNKSQQASNFFYKSPFYCTYSVQLPVYAGFPCSNLSDEIMISCKTGQISDGILNFRLILKKLYKITVRQLVNMRGKVDGW